MMRLSIIAAAIQGIVRSGSGGGGGGGGSYTSQNSTFDALYTAFFAGLTISGTVYISPTGNDTTGTGTYANPWLTISKALTGISANGRIILKNGTYTAGTGGFINQHASAQNLTIPSGTGGNYTIIQAETPFEVYIDQSSAVYYGSLVHLTSTGVCLDGLSFRHDLVPAELAPFSVGTDNLITRCRFRTRQCGQFNGVVHYSTGTLIEDCSIYGGGRYQFVTGSLSASAQIEEGILRRVIARMDWALGDQPCGTFGHYGSDDTGYTLSRNTSRQNCIAIDGPAIPNQGSDGGKYGSFYDPKSSRGLTDIGCISLNDKSNYAAWMGEYSSTGSNTDCAVYDCGSADAFRQTSGTRTVTNCLLSVVGGSDYNGATNSSNNRSSDTPGNIVQRSAGAGADILYCVGGFLKKYGDTGWDVPDTSMPLWPWPYEDKHATWMDTQIALPASHYPTSPANSRQSFTGTALDGNAMTLTRRIWEAAGTAMPDLTTVY